MHVARRGAGRAQRGVPPLSLENATRRIPTPLRLLYCVEEGVPRGPLTGTERSSTATRSRSRRGASRRAYSRRREGASSEGVDSGSQGAERAAGPSISRPHRRLKERRPGRESPWSAAHARKLLDPGRPTHDGRTGGLGMLVYYDYGLVLSHHVRDATGRSSEARRGD